MVMAIHNALNPSDVGAGSINVSGVGVGDVGVGDIAAGDDDAGSTSDKENIPAIPTAAYVAQLESKIEALKGETCFSQRTSGGRNGCHTPHPDFAYTSTLLEYKASRGYHRS